MTGPGTEAVLSCRVLDVLGSAAQRFGGCVPVRVAHAVCLIRVGVALVSSRVARAVAMLAVVRTGA